METIGVQLESTLNGHKVLSLEKARKIFTKENLSNLDPKKGLIVDQIWDSIKYVLDNIEKDQFFVKE